MELRTYWRIFLRRWWIAALLTSATAVISLLTSPIAQGGGYTATMRVLLSAPSERPTGSYFTYDRYYSLLSTEYLTDDFIEVVRSQAFRDDVRKELGATAPAAFTLQSQPRSERAPRILTIVVTAGSAADAGQVAEAAARVLTTRAGEYFAGLGPAGLAARVIDPPVVAAPTAGGRNLLNVALRTALALLLGLGLVFLLHYLDTTLYGAEDVERYLGLPVLLEVPPYQDTVGPVPS